MLAVSAGILGYAAKKTSAGGAGGEAGGKSGGTGVLGGVFDEKKIPLMGIMGAFVFAGQMINFTIPATGSSGHIGGGILLAALLGPFPALLTLASVLLIQCLFFADGGLLAYGCNVFNMGVTAALAYQFIFKPLVKKDLSKKRIVAASVLSVIAGLQVGAFCVVLETFFSGISALPFGGFLLLMQPIHLAIGLVEGLVTAAVLCYVQGVRPELLESSAAGEKLPAPLTLKKVLVTFIVLTVITGGILSLFASANPDGLEWSMEGVAGTAELEQAGPVYDTAAAVVERTAFMPDYGFTGENLPEAAGTAAAGIVGSLITLLLAGLIGLGIRAARRKAEA
jgi:cobalt/nickel transport system permease protein